MLRNLLLIIIYCIFFIFSTYATEITILHTNDIHCAVDEGVELSGVAWLKKVYMDANLPVILVDAGDAVQGAPLGSLTKGQAIIRLMNATGYDFAIPGNHEFDYGMEQFKYLNDLLDCHYYSCNLTEEGETFLDGYKIIECNGKQIAFIGVTTPASLHSVNPICFSDSQNYKKRIYGFKEKGKQLYQIVQKTVDKVKSLGAYKIILVAHFGNHVDNWSVRDLVGNITGIDAVIDGHSHENYIDNMVDQSGKMVVVAQTGSRLQSLGRLIIAEDGMVKADNIKQLAGKDGVVKNGLEYEKGVYTDMLMQTFGKSDFELYVNHPVTHERMVRNGETNLGDFVTDAFRKIMDVDVAIMNGGGLRENLSKGNITLRDILSVLPFSNRLSTVKLTGAELADVLEYAVRKCPQEIGSFLQVSGLTFDLNLNVKSPVVENADGSFLKIKSNKRRVQNIRVGNELLDLKRSYLLAGPDYIVKNGGDGFVMFRKLQVEKQSMLFDRDVISEYIRKELGGKIPNDYAVYCGQGRIKIKC